MEQETRATDGAAPGPTTKEIKRLSFVFYGEQGKPCLKIYDARTGELLKTIPPEQIILGGAAVEPTEPEKSVDTRA